MTFFQFGVVCNSFLPAIHQGTAIQQVGSSSDKAPIRHLTDSSLPKDVQRRRIDLIQTMNRRQLERLETDQQMEGVMASNRTSALSINSCCVRLDIEIVFLDETEFAGDFIRFYPRGFFVFGLLAPRDAMGTMFHMKRMPALTPGATYTG